MYELIILSLLMYERQMHGYLIAKITNDMIGPWARVSNGTLYPLLTKLEKEGLITASTDSSQQQRGVHTFMITGDGRKRFHQLMMDTNSNPGEYQKFFQIKVTHIEFIEAASHSNP